MVRAVQSIILRADCNATQSSFIEIKSGGGCIHINVHESDIKAGYVNFQMHESVFQQWADAFQLFARSK